MRSGIDFGRFFGSLLLFEKCAGTGFLASVAFWRFICWVLFLAQRSSAASAATRRVFKAPSGCLSFGSLLMNQRRQSATCHLFCWLSVLRRSAQGFSPWRCQRLWHPAAMAVAIAAWRTDESLQASRASRPPRTLCVAIALTGC